MKVEIEIKTGNAKIKHSTLKRKRTRIHRERSEVTFLEAETGKKKDPTSCSKWFNVIPKGVAILVALYPIVEYVYNYFYGQQCESFYHIPAKYFSKSVNSSMLYIALLIPLLAVPLLRKWFVTTGKSNKFSLVWDGLITPCYGFALGYINILSLLKICASNNSYFWQLIDRCFSEHIVLFVVIIMVISIITIMGSTIIDLLKRTENRILQIAVYAVLFTSVALSVVIFLTGTEFVLNPDPAGKTIYEIADCKGEKYVVLSEYNGKLLVVPAEIDEDNAVGLDTTWYSFIDVCDCKVYILDFEHVPQIKRINGTE